MSPRLCGALPTKALGSILGSPEENTDHVRNQTSGKMELRCKPSTLRQPRKGGAALRETSRESEEASGGIAAITEGNGYRIFHPKVSNGLDPVLELFAGCASLSKAFCRLGFTVHAYDFIWGEGGDILNFGVFQKIIRSIQHKIFSFVHMGMPCESWSRARKNDGLGPPPLRDDGQNLYGFTCMSFADLSKIDRGNRLLLRTFQLAKTCIDHCIPFTIENPASSRAWLTDEMQTLERLGATPQLVHYCQYGKAWKKATVFLGWRVPNFHFKLCTGTSGICSHTGFRHTHLQGTNSSGVFLTLIAQPYPTGLTHTIAATMHQYLQNTPKSGVGAA